MAVKKVTEVGVLLVSGTLKLAKGFTKRPDQDLQVTVTLTIVESDELPTATTQQVMDFLNYLGIHETPFLLTIGDEDESPG